MGVIAFLVLGLQVELAAFASCRHQCLLPEVLVVLDWSHRRCLLPEAPAAPDLSHRPCLLPEVPAALDLFHHLDSC